METEISGRVRNAELVKIINWIPKVWHHLNRFLEAHSSSDVTIGRWGARRQEDGGRSGLPRALATSCAIIWVLARTGPSRDIMLSSEIKKGRERDTSSHRPHHYLENPMSLLQGNLTPVSPPCPVSVVMYLTVVPRSPALPVVSH